MGILFVIGACTLWAIDTLIRYPLISSGVGANSIVFTEHAILVLLFTPYIIKNSKKIWSARVSHIFYFMIIGGLGSALATLSFTRAFSLVNPSLVILLQKLQPIVAILLARVVLKEAIKKEFILWGSLCLIGGLLISYKDVMPGLLNFDFSVSVLNKKSLLGYGLALVAVFGWGASTVFGKKLSYEGYKEGELMAGRFLFGLLFLLPLVAAGPVPVPTDINVGAKILIMVLLSGLLGMFLYYEGLKRISARLCALAEMFFPFCAIAVNWVFLGATLDIYQAVGGLLLLVGSTVIQIKHY